jgi:hypothetical protein
MIDSKLRKAVAGADNAIEKLPGGEPENGSMKPVLATKNKLFEKPRILSGEYHNSIIHLEPVSQHLKARCVRASTRQSKKLVPWAIEMLTLCCEASEEVNRNKPPPSPLICTATDGDGFQCSLHVSHEGAHEAVDTKGRLLARWPQQEVTCPQ